MWNECNKDQFNGRGLIYNRQSIVSIWCYFTGTDTLKNDRYL